MLINSRLKETTVRVSLGGFFGILDKNFVNFFFFIHWSFQQVFWHFFREPFRSSVFLGTFSVQYFFRNLFSLTFLWELFRPTIFSVTFFIKTFSGTFQSNIFSGTIKVEEFFGNFFGQILFRKLFKSNIFSGTLLVEDFFGNFLVTALFEWSFTLVIRNRIISFLWMTYEWARHELRMR